MYVCMYVYIYIYITTHTVGTKWQSKTISSIEHGSWCSCNIRTGSRTSKNTDSLSRCNAIVATYLTFIMATQSIVTIGQIHKHRKRKKGMANVYQHAALPHRSVRLKKILYTWSLAAQTWTQPGNKPEIYNRSSSNTTSTKRWIHWIKADLTWMHLAYDIVIARTSILFQRTDWAPAGAYA